MCESWETTSPPVSLHGVVYDEAHNEENAVSASNATHVHTSLIPPGRKGHVVHTEAALQFASNDGLTRYGPCFLAATLRAIDWHHMY
jgi:hypothetical protein